MRKRLGRFKTPQALVATLLVAGAAAFPVQAAVDRSASPFDPAWIFYTAASVLFFLAMIGVWRWMRRWRARVLRERDEEIMQLMNQWTRSLQQEVAERKEAQRALQESQELTLRQERLAAVGQLAAGLAHEFNNILTIIQGHASLLLDNPKMDEESVKSINHISHGVERTASLVKQMLAFSRQQVMQQKILQINDTMSGIADMLRRLLGPQVVLRFDIAPELPPIVADPDMLQQIIVNLVANARDAMSSGGRLTIRVSEARFIAKDLARQTRPPPGPFHSIERHRHRFRHRLLGHQSNLRTVLHHQGHRQGHRHAAWPPSMAWSTRTPAGSKWKAPSASARRSFDIYFPAAEHPPEKPALKIEAPRAANGGETVLVVEDEAVLRELVREILEASGYRVLDAASGREALQVWEKQGRTLIYY